MEAEAFFTEWVRQEESLVSSLLLAISAENHADQSRLAALSISHFESYFLHKTRLAERDIVHAFYPRYLTPFELTFLWLGGFRPSLAFKFVPSGHQSDAATCLRRTVLAEERELSKQMASLQEGLAARELLEAMRSRDGTRNGDVTLKRATSAVGAALCALLASADRLRLRTLRGIMEVLTPADAAKFTVNAMKFHLEVRRFGLTILYYGVRERSGSRGGRPGNGKANHQPIA